MYRISAVRFDPITSLFGNQGGFHQPAVVLFFPEIPIEPVAAGASLLDKRHGNGVFVDIHADKECARLRHGGPPS